MKELRLSMFSILFRASWSYELSFPTREYLLPKGAQWSCRLGLFFGDKKTHDFPIQVDFRKESPISAMDSNRWSGPIKQGLSQWGMAQYGLLLQNCRKRQEKTEKDRKRQKEPERDRKRQKETKTDRKSSIQHMSSHVRSCCNMPANGRSTVVNGIILFKAVAWHRSHAFNSITRFKSRASQSEGC